MDVRTVWQVLNCLFWLAISTSKIMMKINIHKFFFILLALFVWSCEEEFIPDIELSEPEIVVEGFIEAGDASLPPYVLLTRSIPFFKEIRADQISNLFVHDALVTISDGNETVTLQEVCWNDFNQEEKELLLDVLKQLGESPDTSGLNFCVYLDPTFSIFGEVGKTYDLRIESEGEVITSTTTIPEHVPVDSLWFIDPPGNVADTLMEMRCIASDPAGNRNYYRYMTSVNNGPFIPGYNSVGDDALFDGKQFEFPLPKGEQRDVEGDINTFGLYTKGDTVTLKWMSIDQGQFDFWLTLEFNSVNQGPFSNYTLIDHNVEGGLGVWGGFSASYYRVIVQ